MTGSPDSTKKYCRISVITNTKLGPTSIDSVFKEMGYNYFLDRNGLGTNTYPCVELEWFDKGNVFSTSMDAQKDVFTMFDIKNVSRLNATYKQVRFKTNCMVTDPSGLNSIFLYNIQGKIAFKDER